MKINEILQPGVVQPNRGVTGKASAAVPAQPASKEGIAVDQAEFHQGAKVEAHLLEGAKLVYEAIPDVRADRVAQARQRLAEGYYDRPEVIDQIAARMVADPEAAPLASPSLAKQAEIRRRLDEGFYDSPEAVEKIVSGLVEDAGA